MKVAIEDVINYLIDKGFDCTELELCSLRLICVKADVAGRQISLVHHAANEITRLPRFMLLEPEKFGQLAHVTLNNFESVLLGDICVNDKDSISVNFSMPLQAIEESLLRHIQLLKKVISDPEWNRQELLREFYSNWLLLCDPMGKHLLLTGAQPILGNLNVYAPPSKHLTGADAFHLVEPTKHDISPIAGLSWGVDKGKRRLAGKALLIPLKTLNPPPQAAVDIPEWFIDTMEDIPASTMSIIQQKYSGERTKEYWIVFTSNTPSGRTWFALHCQSKNKQHSLPLTNEKLKNWKVMPICVQVFDKETVVPRGGGRKELSEKKVALIGAGSVGCEIAHKLSSSGIEYLDIYDPDYYSIDNLYRHNLPHYHLNALKSQGLCWALHNQFPWSKARPGNLELLGLRDREKLKHYDLLVIAIGSPTHERLFKQYLLDEKVSVPVIYTWLEGFGVGGHAVLDIPSTKGCLLCAYVCQETLRRGLSPNLSFIEANQNVTKNIAGCGDQYISYSAVCSAQTALLATDLAVRFLEKRIEDSSKISWKGSDYEATENNIKLTHRYYAFKDSLKVLPLTHEDCDVCS